jgi:hypothetical protein
MDRGRTVVIEYRWAEGNSQRFKEIAAELIQFEVDIIFAVGTESALAAKQATATSRLSFRWLAIQSAPVLSLRSRDWAEMRLDCQTSLSILRRSGSISSGRFCRASNDEAVSRRFRFGARLNSHCYSKCQYASTPNNPTVQNDVTNATDQSHLLEPLSTCSGDASLDVERRKLSLARTCLSS